MSTFSQASNNGSLPSESNKSSFGYGDENGLDILYPSDDENDDEITSVKVSIPPSKLRIMNRIIEILGENSEEYNTFISNIYYNWKFLNRKYPEKYRDIMKYIDKRIIS